MQLSGWYGKRRVVILRRPMKGDAAIPLEDNGQSLLGFIELDRKSGQLYRDRADAENAFDELKNQWGWGGFTTHDLHRCQLSARAVALMYTWWSLFVRLADPKERREANRED